MKKENKQIIPGEKGRASETKKGGGGVGWGEVDDARAPLRDISSTDVAGTSVTKMHTVDGFGKNND